MFSQPKKKSLDYFAANPSTAPGKSEPELYLFFWGGEGAIKIPYTVRSKKYIATLSPKRGKKIFCASFVIFPSLSQVCSRRILALTGGGEVKKRIGEELLFLFSFFSFWFVSGKLEQCSRIPSPLLKGGERKKGEKEKGCR